LSAIANYFRFAERGTNLATEIRGGATTYLVMAYIIFLNPAILSAGLHLSPVAVAAATALVAGVMTILMGVTANLPLALAAGLGINAIVAFTLPAKGLSPEGAMGVIVIEGILILVLVALGVREKIMRAVPVSLRLAIGVGIGLFLMTIALVNAGIVVTPKGGVPIVSIAPLTQASQFVFLFGLALIIALFVLRVRGAFLISIALTTVLAILVGVQKIDTTTLVVTPDFSTLGHFDLFDVFTKLGVVTAILTIFAVMLSDFFDTMGTVTAVSDEAGLTSPTGEIPGLGRALIVDSVAAIAGGAAGISSNTTYIESAAGVAEGAKTGFASVITGGLFLLSVLLSPLAGFVPSVATAPALVLVGYLMFRLIPEIPISDVEEGIPALLTMILMPLTYDITVGIGAGFIAWTFIKVIRGRASVVHPLMYAVSILFLVYFARDIIESLVK
jgi:AGZA family xanthine/uracil permease-like MFS transporter